MTNTAGVSPLRVARDAVIADRSRHGRAFCRALSDVTDDEIVALFDGATGGRAEGLALVAVGGYGRGELAPGSDLDLWLLHDGAVDVAETAGQIWYPIWDAGLKLGHAVRTPKQALEAASDDLDTATAALTARHLAGDRSLSDGLAERALAQWRKRSKRWLAELGAKVAARHEAAGEVAFLLQPDLKEGRGGLRDAHALIWAEAIRPILLDGDAAALAEAEAVLLAARVELHRLTGRAGDVLTLDLQDDVAGALGVGDADVLMGSIAAAARSTAWISDEAWDRIGASLAGPWGRVARRDREVGPGLVLRDGHVHVDAGADPKADPALVLRAAAAAAANEARFERSSLDRLAADTPPFDGPWPRGARQAFVDLLATGPAAIPVIEALDQRGLMVRILPEWEPTRSKPQRNALHTYTVDRHLCVAASIAAGLTDTVARPDLLLVGALLHDIGKGGPGDHSIVGVQIIGEIAPRMGFDEADTEVLATLVEHHLLLPDIATRRDLGDDQVIASVAHAVGSLATLELLAALTEADSIATGPSAWGQWKAELVAELVERVAYVLRGGNAAEVRPQGFPTPDVRELMAAGATVVRGERGRIVVVTADRVGVASRVAGALALAGIGVVAADASSNDDGMAAIRFRCHAPADVDVDWGAVAADVRRAVEGRLAIEARLADRVRNRRRSAALTARRLTPRVRFDNQASGDSTVVEVHAPDGVGVLYRITRALAEVDLDIRLAKIATLGDEVVDVFYVRTGGHKVTDRDHLREAERAILQQLTLT